MQSPVTILTSAIGLGVYIPALLNQRTLRARGYAAEVEVLEGWFTDDQRKRHLDHRDAFRENFRLALIANRMPRNAQDGFDPTRLDTLLARWATQRRSTFIVWSGFWLPVLDRYLARVQGLEVEVDLCRIDAVVSASFRIQHALRGAACRNIWLWNWEERCLGWHIPVLPGADTPLSYREREARLVVHGGGWAIGTYAEVLPELSSTGYALDVLAPRIHAWPGQSERDRYFAPLPDWHPWERNADGELSFPPLKEMPTEGPSRTLKNEHFPPAHALVRSAHAIVSKPGGGTLIDSLAAATPVVLLEPYGDAEARNGDLWEELGFGISYARWKETGFDQAVLARLHENLLAAAPARTQATYPLDVCAQPTQEVALP